MIEVLGISFEEQSKRLIFNSATNFRDSLIDLFNQHLTCSDKLRDLIVSKLIDGFAMGTGKGQSLQIGISDWHVEFSAALANNIDVPTARGITHNCLPTRCITNVPE